ncbi:MAG: sugar nucleotide-binding protein, partial [Pseudomonadota bacterium]
MNNRQILVTGGKGRLGSALDQLGCTTLGRDQLDICEPDSIAAAFETHTPQIVINAAAYTAVDQAESDPETAYAVNGDAVCFLVDECEHRRIPLIQISTDCVFGDRRPDAPVSEMEEPDPLSVYGFSKRLGEWHAVRPGNV